MRDEPAGPAASPPATVIVPTVSGERARGVTDSLARVGGEFQTLIVDNGTGDPGVREAAAALRGAELVELESNLGYSKAVNLAAARADGEALVLINDDCAVRPGFVERIVAPLERSPEVAMAAGVLLEAADPGLIDSAGVEFDRTLLAFDYLNGEAVEVLDRSPPDPIGPCGAAAAFRRDAFLAAGGFDERLFAYWEDVDLVLRLRAEGARCALAPGARAIHRHSATLGSGSAEKDFLLGFGRGYVLRKWSVLTPRRIPSVLLREVAICAGQAVVDRNLAGIRGRLRGLRAAETRRPYPDPGVFAHSSSAASSLARRWRRRARLRAASR